MKKELINKVVNGNKDDYNSSKQGTTDAVNRQRAAFRDKETQSGQENKEHLSRNREELGSTLSKSEVGTKFSKKNNSEDSYSHNTLCNSRTSAYKTETIKKAMEQLWKHTPRFQNSPLFIPAAHMKSSCYSYKLPFEQENNVNGEQLHFNSASSNEVYTYSNDSYNNDTSMITPSQQVYYNSSGSSSCHAPVYPFNCRTNPYYRRSFRYAMDESKAYDGYYCEANYSNETYNAVNSTTNGVADYSSSQQTIINDPSEGGGYQLQNVFINNSDDYVTEEKKTSTFLNNYTFSLMAPNIFSSNASSSNMYSVASITMPNIKPKDEFYSYPIETTVENSSTNYANGNVDTDSNMWNSVALNNQATCMYDANRCMKRVSNGFNDNTYSLNLQYQTFINSCGVMASLPQQNWVDPKQSKMYDEAFNNYDQMEFSSFANCGSSVQLDCNNNTTYNNSKSMESAWNQAEEKYSITNSSGIIDSVCSTQAVTVLPSPPNTSPATTNNGYDIPSSTSVSSVCPSNSFQPPSQSSNYGNYYSSPQKSYFYKQIGITQQFQPQAKNQQNEIAKQLQEKRFGSSKQQEKCYINSFKTQQQINLLAEQGRSNKINRNNYRSNYKESRRRNRQNNQNLYSSAQKQSVYNGTSPPFHEQQSEQNCTSFSQINLPQNCNNAYRRSSAASVMNVHPTVMQCNSQLYNNYAYDGNNIAYHGGDVGTSMQLPNYWIMPQRYN